MVQSTTYAEWVEHARQHDKVSGMEKWKATEHTSLYDYAEISLRLRHLKQLRGRNDAHGLLFTLNEGIHGNMGGMGKPVLYTRAKYGTKDLINEYIDEIVNTLDFLAKDESGDLDFDEKIDFFHRASLCFGRSALMLSGAGTLGLFHMGVVKALSENGVLPRVISGSSAGAMIAAAIGTHTDEELKHFFEPKNLAVDTDIKKGFMEWLFLGKDGRLDAKYIEAMHAHFIRDMTFQEAYELTGHAINITVSPQAYHQSPRLLNAITSPNVLIRSAVKGSCAVPGALPPVTLEAMSESGYRVPYLPTRKWIDGSVSSDLPAKRLSRLYGVNHFIVSQTNPMVLWGITDPKTEHGILPTLQRISLIAIRETVSGCYQISKKYLKNYPKTSIMASQMNSVVTQQYTGDVNIFPSYRLFDPRKLAKQWNEKEVTFLIREGELSTWPKIEMIKNCMKISNKLDEILEEYDQRNLKHVEKAVPDVKAINNATRSRKRKSAA